MRTRFLTPDYFNSNQTLAFLPFPISPLQPPPPNLSPPLNFQDELLRCCFDSSAIDVSLQLHSFPIDNALSKFYSDVLPHTIDVDYGASPFTLRHSSLSVQVPEKGSDLDYEDRATESWKTSDSETLENRSSEGIIKDVTDVRNETGTAIIQFETPELSQNLENACMFEKEKIQFVSEVQKCDDDMEMLNLELTGPYRSVIKDDVDLVEDICLEYDMEQKTPTPDQVFPLLNNNDACDMLPLFEVDEVGMEDSTWLCLEDEFRSLLQNRELQHCINDDDLQLNCQDLLGSMEIDILEDISGHHTAKVPLEFDPESLNLALDTDCLQVVETPRLVDGCSIPFVETFLFEEFEMLDSESFEVFEAKYIMKEPEMCDQLFHEDMNFKSFDELIVSRELEIIDGSFTSLPVPVLMDEERIQSLHVIVADILAQVEPVPLSTSDEIYLDWHLLGKDKCNDHIHAAIEEVFNDIQDYAIGSNLIPDDGILLVLDFLLSDDPLNGLNIRESKLDMPSEGICSVKQRTDGALSSRLSGDDCQIIETGANPTNADIENFESGNLSDDDCQIIENDGILGGGDFGKKNSSAEFMPQFNDLEFFLNPAKATGGMKIDHRAKVPNAKPVLSGGLHKKEASASTGLQMQQLDIQLHTISLPANIITLIDNLRRSYLEVFEDDMQLNKTESSVTYSNDMNLLRLSEEKLMDHMSRLCQVKSCTTDGDDNAIAFVTLIAIKRMAWCLCFFGIYTLHLLVCKLFQSLDCLKSRLGILHSLIEDAYGAVEKDITKSHPSLAIIKEILQQNTDRKSKVLILAPQVLWGPLKRLLTSMDISFTEFKDLSSHDKQGDLSFDFFDDGPRDHQHISCLLVTHEHISSPMLMQKLDIILEYGGPYDVSKVSTLYPEYVGSRSLHFVKVELDDLAKALCEGVTVASYDRGTINLEELLDFGPIIQNSLLVSSEAADRTNGCSMPIPTCHSPQKSEPTKPCDLSFPNIIIIINTQNFDKEMIISRRSTYQKILTIEKLGVQVVERDLILPVDIIFDAAVCLVWYDSQNIGKKATAQDEGSSSVPCCVENIATNVLTSLSFSFTTCILIFEGESYFLGTITDSADELYAAAASLGINLQIFYSYSLELTNEIILNSVEHAMKSSKGLLPMLPESETLAESFLTKFPSINPLSAHAIISSECMLSEFLEQSAEGRIHALGTYHVSEESVNLLSVLCKYGEREDSKSGVTDCSSSVSSPRENFVCKINSEERKRKFTPSSGDALISRENFVCKINSEERKRKFTPSSGDAMNEFRCSMPSNKHVDDGLNYLNMSRPSVARVSKSPKIYTDSKLPDLLNDEFFSPRYAPDTSFNVAPKAWCKATGSPKISHVRDAFARSTSLSNDKIFSQQNSGGTTENRREEYDGDIFQDLHEDFVGEVVDIYDKSFLGGDFQTADKAMKSSPTVCDNIKDHAPKYNRAARRLSFGSSYQNFPMADEMNTRCGLVDERQWRADNDYNGLEYDWSNSGFEPQKEPFRASSMEKSTVDSTFLLPKEQDVSTYGETPLSKAIHSEKLQQGSPWTIEFLNRIKEKRRLRQQNQPCEASVPHSGYHNNITKFTKRRSPSILEYFKYQGASSSRKPTEQKRPKQQAQSLNKKSSRCQPTWTPIDKRARRTLSFATSGTGSQTNLVWSNNKSPDSLFSNRI